MTTNMRRNYKLITSRVNQRIPSPVPNVTYSPKGGYKIRDVDRFALAFSDYCSNSEYGNIENQDAQSQKLIEFIKSCNSEDRNSPFKFFPETSDCPPGGYQIDQTRGLSHSNEISSPKNTVNHGFIPISVQMKKICGKNKHVQESDVNVDNNNTITINDSVNDNVIVSKNIKSNDISKVGNIDDINEFNEVESNQSNVLIKPSTNEAEARGRVKTSEDGDRWLERMSSNSSTNNASNIRKSIIGLKGFWNPVSNTDFRTQHKPNGKGAACLLFSRRYDFYGNQKLHVLLPLEKHGKYATTYNMFGGHFESDKDNDIRDTVRRELKEEFGDSIMHWIDWKGSYWSFNRSYIEFGSLPEKFDTRGFIENNEILKCNWFAVDDILSSPSDTKEIEVDGKIQKLKYYKLEDSKGNIFRISTYAHGVLTATKKNKHFYINEIDHTHVKQSNVFSRYLSN